MSSRIVLPGENSGVGPVQWRKVGTTVISPEAAKDSAADPSVQIAELEARYQQRVREAHAAGAREGEIAGRNRAAAEMQPVIERLTRSIQEIANLRARLRREAEADVVQLALAIARRVIHREVAADPDALRGLVTVSYTHLSGFQDVFSSAVGQVESMRQQASATVESFLSGEGEDLHLSLIHISRPSSVKRALARDLVSRNCVAVRRISRQIWPGDCSCR